MIFDGKNGPRFLPGQVIESEDGDERFIPGQIMDSLEDGIKRFVPGRNSPSFLNVFSLETFWGFFTYSQVPTKREGPNKQVGWIFHVNFLNK